MQIKITHLSSVHPRDDTRILAKECASLAKINDYEVNFVVADSLGCEVIYGVNIYDVGKGNGRINRIFRSTREILEKAKELQSNIYHFHDPELIWVGLKLKKLGYKVIFDIHENIFLQIQEKEYLPNFLKKPLAHLYKIYEKKSLGKFDMLILAEDSYLEHYQNIATKISIVLNMPDITPLNRFYSKKRDKNELFYIGAVSKDRGLDVTIKAMGILKKTLPDIFMHYVGDYGKALTEIEDKDTIKTHIKFYGRLALYDGLEYSLRAKAGLSILKPRGNYIYSYSTKVFEYMAIGLPVITSNFKLYKDVIERHNCGICVDPNNPKEIADAIKYIFENPLHAFEMGQNGRKAVEDIYNWKTQEEKLIKLYSEILE